MSRRGPLAPTLPASHYALRFAIAVAVIVGGCGAGSDADTMDAEFAEGNGRQVRADYAALESSSGGSSAADESSGSSEAGESSGSSAADESSGTGETARAASDPPAPDAFARKASEAVNLVRSQARACGDKLLPAVGPLRWDVRAANAALLESEWMLASDSFGHVWPGGELVWDRLTMSGYRWNKADENIAAGYRNQDDAMQAWVDSPPHCMALMRPDVVDVAIAVVPGRAGGAYISYWTMVLAAPRPIENQ
jgi:uncharacterized protein YkwD